MAGEEVGEFIGSNPIGVAFVIDQGQTGFGIFFGVVETAMADEMENMGLCSQQLIDIMATGIGAATDDLNPFSAGQCH